MFEPEKIYRHLRHLPHLANPLVWLAVLAIVFAYIGFDHITETIFRSDKNLATHTATENPDDLKSLSITDDNDAARIAEFLQLERIELTINPLFVIAERHVEEGRLLFPEDDNAWLKYKIILKLAPDNKKAAAGIVRIRNILIENTEIAIESGDFTAAENWLSQLDVVAPDSEIQTGLRAAIQQAKGG